MSESESKEQYVVPEQLNYTRMNYAGPKYKYSRVVPLSGNQTVNIPNGSTAEVLIEIPTNVFNLSESYLYANVAIAAQPALHTWFHVDGMPLISEVDLYTRSGIYLCQLPNFQNYMKVVRKLHTNLREFKSNDSQSWLYPSGVSANQVPAITPSNGAAGFAIDENAYVQSTAGIGLPVNSVVNLTLNMKLGAIKKTIFALNKNLVFPDIIVMRLLLGPGNRFAYAGVSGVDPAATPTDIAGANAVSLSNLTLFLATEKNEDLAQAARIAVNSPGGMNILIDFPYTYKQNLGTATSQSLSYRFNRGHGKNLLAIITSPFNNAETNNTAYDNSNVVNVASADNTAVGSKVLNYYSQLDNVRLQDIQVNCGNLSADDYRENRKFCQDSPYMNAKTYNHNWFHQDKFFESNLVDNVPEENLDKGMSLIVERKYDFLANTAAVSLNWYTHAILQKDLHIGSNMIAFQ